jgi:hypothetical protein
MHGKTSFKIYHRWHVKIMIQLTTSSSLSVHAISAQCRYVGCQLTASRQHLSLSELHCVPGLLFLVETRKFELINSD